MNIVREYVGGSAYERLYGSNVTMPLTDQPLPLHSRVKLVVSFPIARTVSDRCILGRLFCYN